MASRAKTTEDPSEATAPEAPLSLVAKLARIGAAVTTVEKKGYNDHHKYAYVREPELFEAVRGGLADAQIMILPCVTGLDRSPTLVTLHMDFQILDGQSGETLHIPWFAEGQDNSDKGINKALTAAMKYFIYKLFLIPTTDERGEYTDAENTRFSPAATAPTPRGGKPTNGADSPSGGILLSNADRKEARNGSPYIAIRTSDGRSATSYDENIIQQCVDAHAQKTLVQVDIQEIKGHNKVMAISPTLGSPVLEDTPPALTDDDIPF